MSQRKGIEVKQHECFKNWSGSSSSMEADIIVDGFLQSSSLHKVKYTRMIADGDSNVYIKVPVSGVHCQKILQVSPTMMLDTTEDPVRFEIPLLHAKEKPSRLKREQMAEMVERGARQCHGHFTRKEDARIKKNFNRFISRYFAEFEWFEPHLLLGIGSDRRANTQAFLAAKHFYVRLAKGLGDRQLYSVWRRARTLFHPLRNKERFSREELDSALEAREEHGNKWEIVGQHIGRSGESTRAAVIWHEEAVRTGPWSSAEVASLKAAVAQVSGVGQDELPFIDEVPWAAVSSLVPTRNASQCRSYWGERLATQLRGAKWRPKNILRLVRILREEEEPFVWPQVARKFGGGVSWQLLRRKWYHVRQRRKFHIRAYGLAPVLEKLVHTYERKYRKK
ncbi:hypothetical protein JTE90_002350 [Oedothorax gibbosus]|uniref:Cyclin-D-binding Myb-like transcription factor 1 n=1 Tax=Oedothorax gibbosus TaxID=931172 RepID=A0AAV6UL59_9ARAC|nr:hypothetical protein JTE90_002350 [Oedothorax gibbosus]